MSRFHDALARTQEQRAQTSPIPIRPKTQTRTNTRSLETIHPAYETVVQKLLGQPAGQRPNVILVASSIPGEGTSTVSRNLANALSQSGVYPTLLVDANLRTPSQHDSFGISRTKGLSDVVAGTVDLSTAVRNGYGAGLSVIPCGKPARSPSQLLTLDSLRNTIHRLRSQFQFIILDGPPVTAFPDASTLASHADAIVLVVKAESTRWEVVEEAKKLLEQTETPIFGAVLNRRKYHIPDQIYGRL